MTERTFDLPRGGIYTITDEAVTALLGTGSGEAARLYLYLLSHRGKCLDKEACAALGMAPAALKAALQLLQTAGVLREVAPPAAPPLVNDARPDYAGAEVAQGIKRDPAFRHVVDEVQRRLGKILSSNDLQILFGLYDWRGLTPGLISLLVSHCLEDARRRFGEGGRPPTMRQIDKEAAIWEQKGLDTEEKAERYIETQETRRQAGSRIYRLLGIESRAPSPSESRYVSEWTDMGFAPDAVALAYDKTVLKTGALNWKYMNSILRNWHEKNLHTPSEIESGDTAPAKRTPAGTPAGRAAAAAAPGRREREAVERMRRYVKGE
ncbi:MAG: DnaD domain protein [Oscillospiraceae bacterium]|jgi:DnaD/phage-associated family protein|nr:DnaD domain protein [Oscillospiraceae bacterium]